MKQDITIFSEDHELAQYVIALKGFFTVNDNNQEKSI